MMSRLILVEGDTEHVTADTKEGVHWITKK